jgi:nitrite reductase (NO-forming)
VDRQPPIPGRARRPALTVQQAGRPTITRGTDRQITFAGVLVAVVFLALAAISAMASAAGWTTWLPLHLAMAGAAGTAIAAVLPFFTAALAQVGPARPAIRIGSIVLVAGGSVFAAIAMNGGATGVAVAGGGAYVTGLLALAASAFLPLRAAIGSRLRLVHLAYGAAMAQVAVGVLLATAMLAGWSPVASAWPALKPAHAWLNVFGFVTLVVAASLLHLAPTVAGARIRPRRSVRVAITCLMGGAPLIAAGYGVGWDLVGRAGAVVELVGVAALAVHAAEVQRDRGQWTSDIGWHRFAGLSLLAAPIWLLVAVTIGAWRILSLGPTPAAWSVGLIAVPLVAGGIGQVLVGAWTHLVPAIGPGDQAVHAIQRRWLGRAAVPRWLAWNAGAILATAGVPIGAGTLIAVGGMLLGGALLAGLVLLGGSLALSRRRAQAAAV